MLAPIMSTGNGPAISIRRRLLILLLPSLLALMLAGVFANYRAAMLVVQRVYDQRLSEQAMQLAARIEIVNGRLHVSGPMPALDAHGEGAGGPRYAIRAGDGQLIAGDSRLHPAPASLHPTLADTELAGEAFRTATLRVELGAGRHATVIVAEPVGQRAATGHFLLASTWLVDFIQVDVTLLLVWIAVHFGLKPLMAIRRQIESRSARELEPLQIDAVPTEIRPLAEALNFLFDMLREATRSQRQFVADTAHQLRTPIAGLSGHLELLLREPSAAPIRTRLEELHDGMGRLAHSANQLLALARAEPSASLGARFETLELRILVGRVVELHLNRALHAGHDLGVDAQPAAVTGDARLMEDLIGNLLDNAMSYTPPGSRVTVRCGTESERAFLEVEDDGPGIPESERMRVRQRFYRLPGTQGRGCGLGLAIVEEIAQLHGAVLTIESGLSGRGTRATVRFGHIPRKAR